MNSTSLKFRVFERDKYICHYCGLKMRKQFEEYNRQKKENKLNGTKMTIKRKHVLLTVDHIIPRSRGGEWSMENLITSCKPCNLKKANYETKELLSLRNKTVVSRLLEMLVVWGKWAEKRRLRNTSHSWQNK